MDHYDYRTSAPMGAIVHYTYERRHVPVSMAMQSIGDFTVEDMTRMYPNATRFEVCHKLACCSFEYRSERDAAGVYFTTFAEKVTCPECKEIAQAREVIAAIKQGALR